jgi:hypothetical protein
MRLRTLFSAALLTVALAATACTGDDPSSSSGALTSPSESPIVTPSYGAVDFVPGEYQIGTSGIEASLSMDERSGTMSVTNGSTIDLGEAEIVIVTRSQDVVPATVQGPPAVRIGETAEFTVEFPEDLTLADAGLIRLAFDGVSLAVFGPVVAEEG